MDRIVLADIPGLIEGASKGRGLGTSFLKHIEKTRVLLHCVDVTSENLFHDYETVRKEFRAYSDGLSQKKEVILVTKIDLVDEKTVKKKMSELRKVEKEIYTVSIFSEESLKDLKNLIKKVINWPIRSD